MKKITNRTVTMVVLMSALLIVLVNVITPTGAQGLGEGAEECDGEGYIIRAPISIDGNDDFAAQATAEGWTGAGTEEDPYIIQGYEIDGSGYGYGIYIGNTTGYFVIKDCYIHNVSDGYGSIYFDNQGIMLYSVQNGEIYGNIFYEVRKGIELRKSQNNIIGNNTITVGYDRWGIYLISSSDHNLISNNTIQGQSTNQDGLVGITLALSNHNRIIGNDISNFKIGIHIEYDYGFDCENILDDNTFFNTDRNIVLSEDKNGPVIPSFSFALSMIAIQVAVLLIWKKKK